MDKPAGNSKAPSPIRICRIEVDGLFGRYDHQIELHRDERVSILHGPNGVGKTAILRMVDDLFTGHSHPVSRVPFRAMRVVLSSSDSGSTGLLEVFPLPPSGGEEGYELQFTVKDRIRRVRWIPEVQEISGDDDAAWFLDLRKRVRTHLIGTQRLEQQWVEHEEGYPPDLVSSVSGDARDLARRIEETMARFGRDGQALEQAFPQRLLRMSNGASVLDGATLRQRLAALDARRGELERLGLLEQVESHPIDPGDFETLEATEKKVLTLYVEDSEKKLEILQNLASRIQLFLNFVNRKFRHKSIAIEREDGFFAHGSDDRRLDLDALSSGEQHELVLLYDLLFRVEPDTLVLIDEPEISLHLAWQRQFLPELLEIVKVARFDALVATHSPFIVGDRSDLMIPLSDES